MLPGCEYSCKFKEKDEIKKHFVIHCGKHVTFTKTNIDDFCTENDLMVRCSTLETRFLTKNGNL